MKKLHLLFCYFLLLTISAFGQRGTPTYVFSLSARQAAYFYQHPYDSLDVSSLSAPIDSFRFSFEEAEREPGHYLYVQPQLEDLEIELRSYYAYQLQIRNNDRDLALELVDADGHIRHNADIRLGKRKIPFDEPTQTYRRKNWYRDGLLSIAIGQDTLFYELEGYTSRPLLSRKITYWRQSKVGYWLTTPIRWIEQSYRYVKRGIGWGDWRFYNNPFWFLKREHGFRGYVAGNQPLYRPGDTLKVKAFLTNNTGKPWSQKVRVKIWSRPAGSYGTQYFVDSILTSKDPGHFEMIWPLSDTLPLDQMYYVDFEHAHREKFESLKHQFRLEDYELDEATFTLDLKQETYHRGEKISLQAEGRDKNEKIIPGAGLQLTLMVEDIRNIYPDSLKIPDTLWTHRENLRDQEPTQLLIPDTIFPKADLNLKLYATFVHPSGELQQLERQFAYRHPLDKLILNLEGDSITATLERNGLPQNGLAILTRNGAQSEELPSESDTIHLPYREVVSPYFDSYELTLDSLHQKLDVWQDQESMVLVSGQWQPDTISISLTNPRQLNISWLLQSRTKEIRRGSFSGSSGRVNVPVGKHVQWELSYEYFWARPISESQKIYRLDKQLNIAIEQPLKVSPGETVQVKVKVQDPYGKAAAGVQLAAAAVNAQFKNPQDAYKSPVIPYKSRRDPFTIENFSLQPLVYKDPDYYQRGITPGWFRKLNLQGNAFYHMRFKNSGVWMHWHTLEQDTFYRNIAQVAPYLLQDGKALPVYLIYINDELVHYFASQDHPPYSFVGREGNNRIALRTREREYILDSVRLEKGKKLELAIDLDHFKDGMQGIKLSSKTVPDQFTREELTLIKNKALVLVPSLQVGEQYFWDRTTNIHAIKQWPVPKESMVMVPFRASSDINYVHRGKLERQFLFEPGYRYDIAATRERLYNWDSYKRLQDDFRRKSPNLHQPGQLIYRPEDIRREAPASVPILYYDSFIRERVSGKGRLQLEEVPAEVDSLSMLAFLLQSEKGNEWTFPTHRSIIGGLDPGKYQLLLVREDGQVSQKRFELLPNTTLVLNLAGVGFREDKRRNWPEHLYKTSRQEQPDRKAPKTSPPVIQRNPYEGNGQLIQGQITDDNGYPLIGASVLVKGTKLGTITDLDGYYSIWVPAGGAELVINYTGYTTEEIFAGPGSQTDVKLAESSMMLEEVVVTGLGVSKKQNLSAAVQTLEGRTAGVMLTVPGTDQRITIRGLGEPIASQPVVIINGAVSSLEALQLLAPEAIASVEILQDSEALSLYGARAVNGVYLITLQTGAQVPEPEIVPQEAGSSLRDEFRDYAFWNPKLITDQKGEAYFQATFPDNITAWNTYVLGMDRKQRAGVGLARTQSWKSLTARLNIPRFLVDGDEVNVVGQAVNYTQDTLSVSTFFRQGDQELFRKSQQLSSSLTDIYPLQAPEAVDSIELIYGLEAGSYEDGEKRDIPIFPAGSIETEGHFMVLQGDTSIHLSFSKELPIHIFVADNLLELLLEDLDYLKSYPHECMEQTASRLIALELEQEIRGHLKQEFEGERLAGKLLKKLEKAQRPDGSWGWWPGNTGSVWITRHVMEALQLARNSPELSDAEQKGIRFLVNALPEMSAQDQLLTLDLLSGFRQQLDYEEYLPKLDSINLSLHDRLLLTRIRQRAELPYQLDTLDKYRQQTLYGASYWGDPLPNFWVYRRYEHPIATTLIAYELLKGAGREQEARRVQQYFLENRGIGQPQTRNAWYNTFETARVLAALLPDLLQDGQPLRKNRIRLSDRVLDSFPYRAQLTDRQNLHLEKTGTGPLYLTAYQEYHNRQPEAKADIFNISSRLYQNERMVDSLEQGQVASLEVTLRNEVDAEYVMLEIPIPAACSYADRSVNWRLEDHREYRREKVVIYCSRLAAGEHTFEVSLEARFNGHFTLNPARAEQMYFPVLYGRNEMKKMVVK